MRKLIYNRGEAPVADQPVHETPPPAPDPIPAPSTQAEGDTNGRWHFPYVPLQVSGPVLRAADPAVSEAVAAVEAVSLPDTQSQGKPVEPPYVPPPVAEGPVPVEAPSSEAPATSTPVPAKKPRGRGRARKGASRA